VNDPATQAVKDYAASANAPGLMSNPEAEATLQNAPKMAYYDIGAVERLQQSMGPTIRSTYLHAVLDPTHLAGKLSSAQFHLKNVPFDSFAFSGLSGALFAPVLAFVMNKTVTAVRKKDESCHSYCRVEGNLSHKLRYVIVDDCVASGYTVEGIYQRIREAVPSARCYGLYLYYYEEWCPNYFDDIPGMSKLDARGLHRMRVYP
jgi:hypothetical protein